jgi:predicted lactoylglutathione lyase
MSTKIFVNLPVRDLQQSIDFWTRLGFSFNAQFTDDKATSMIVGDDIYIMLLVEERFRDFTSKDIADTATQTEAIIALSAESRDGVDELVDKALQAGGKPSQDPMDEGFMYGRSFQDPDGHLWEVVWMDPSVIEPQ